MMRNIVAILRGIQPAEVDEVGSALIEAGIAIIEVPMNSRKALVSIQGLQKACGENALIGAGTVLSVLQVQAVADAGGKFIVSPNFDRRVVEKTKSLGLSSWPGVMTPTECIAAATAARADGLKLFPASLITPGGLKAIRAVLPPETRIMAVGGIGASNFCDWLQAGADGFGIGTSLYRPGMSPDAVRKNALKIVKCFDRVSATLNAGKVGLFDD